MSAERIILLPGIHIVQSPWLTRRFIVLIVYFCFNWGQVDSGCRPIDALIRNHREWVLYPAPGSMTASHQRRTRHQFAGGRLLPGLSHRDVSSNLRFKVSTLSSDLWMVLQRLFACAGVGGTAYTFSSPYTCVSQFESCDRHL